MGEVGGGLEEVGKEGWLKRGRDGLAGNENDDRDISYKQHDNKRAETRLFTNTYSH